MTARARVTSGVRSLGLAAAIVSAACAAPSATSAPATPSTPLRSIGERECDLIAAIPTLESSLETLRTAITAGDQGIAAREISKLRATMGAAMVPSPVAPDLGQALLALTLDFDAISVADAQHQSAEIDKATAEIALIKIEVTNLATQGIGCT